MTEISVTTVWLDLSCNADIVTHGSLCQIDPYLTTFRDCLKCIEYITGVYDDASQILLLVTTMETTACDFLLSFLKLLEGLPHVDSIYIVYDLSKPQILISSPLNKVCGVYTDTKSLCDKLKQLPNIKRHRREGALRQDFTIATLPNLSEDLMSFSESQLSTALPPNDHTDRQAAEFMYSQMLRDILVDMESSKGRNG